MTDERYMDVPMGFEVKDCTLITRMAGVDSAMTLRELRERVTVCPVECLFHHFCETVLRPTFDDPEFRNDFAVWAARNLRDRVLAERLGILNPYAFNNFEALREAVIDTIDDRMSELSTIPTVKRGEEFQFMQAATVVFTLDWQIEGPNQLPAAIPRMTNNSIYYHFIEARRRTEGGIDDFTAWLQDCQNGHDEMIQALSEIDFYYMTLTELKDSLIVALSAPPSKARIW